MVDNLLYIIIPVLVIMFILNFIYGSIKFIIIGIIVIVIIIITKEIIKKFKSKFENKEFIFEIDDFLTSEECENLIKENDNNLFKSKVLSKDKYSSGRISSQKWIKNDKLNKKLLKLAQKYTNIKLTEKNAENIQFAKYDTKGKYDAHYDICDPINNGAKFIDKCKEDFKNYGSVRFLTILVYLNDNYIGGETKFTKINKIIKPTKGKALVFLNCNLDNESYKNGLCNKIEDSLHAGLPVTEGTKYIINKWYRIKEF